MYAAIEKCIENIIGYASPQIFLKWLILMLKTLQQHNLATQRKKTMYMITAYVTLNQNSWVLKILTISHVPLRNKALTSAVATFQLNICWENL